MPYTITIPHDTPQALAYVEKAKKLDFVKVTELKELEDVREERWEVMWGLAR